MAPDPTGPFPPRRTPKDPSVASAQIRLELRVLGLAVAARGGHRGVQGLSRSGDRAPRPRFEDVIWQASNVDFKKPPKWLVDMDPALNDGHQSFC